MSEIQNPILRGFHPDPSICRAGDDYYIAVSTFEWYPGVLIYHSRNLGDWRLVARPLDRADLLDMRGAPDSCGVWAPCLSWHDGLFYLVYTDVRRFDGNFKDTHNYLVTSPSIDGEWSDRIYLNSSGFDPSLFHDDDGRKWLTNMIWDHRPDRPFFGGIALQEFSPAEARLVGEQKLIFEGTNLGCTEAPHLYRDGDFYYLVTAEGGTGYGHAITMARSPVIDGNYEPDPGGPVLTSRYDPDWPLQRAGHGDIVWAADGDIYLVHLCGRPLPGTRCCPLGRETALQRLAGTDDGWFRLAGGGHLPALSVPAPDLPAGEPPADTVRSTFDDTRLDPVFQWLRTPYPDDFMSLGDRPGWLRLYGMESPGSLYRQALVARRQQDFACVARTEIEFEPDNFQQLAGLICYYNSAKFHYLYISTDDDLGRHLGIMSCEADRSLAVTFPIQNARIALPATAAVFLEARIDGDRLEFAWSLDGEEWHAIPAGLDHSLLADEAGMENAEQFTGAFVGMCANDLTGSEKPADFHWFEYRGLDGRSPAT